MKTDYFDRKCLMKYLISVLLAIIIFGICFAEIGKAASIEDALTWAVAIANDDTHGYSQANRNGNPDYDCSSFVLSALKQAGFDVGQATVTSNMRSNLTQHGFTWIPWSSIGDTSNLKRGDILLAEYAHTEFYLGNGQNVAAHDDRGHPESGDQDGTEVNVNGYYFFPWDGVLRYDQPVIDVTNIKLSQTSLKLEGGTSVSLSATISPSNATDQNIIWSSSNNAIAVVDQKGKVTALASGQATVTASAGGKKATCTILVYSRGEDVIGDINIDGYINAIDGLQAARCAVNEITLNTMGKYRADVNQDGLVDAKDILQILKKSVNAKDCCF